MVYRCPPLVNTTTHLPPPYTIESVTLCISAVPVPAHVGQLTRDDHVYVGKLTRDDHVHVITYTCVLVESCQGNL